MPRSNKKPSPKAKKVKMPTGKFVFLDVTIQDMIKTALVGKEYFLGNIISIIAVVVVVYIMAQLRVSVKREAQNYIDNKPSYNRYKRNIMRGTSGRIACTIRALFLSASVKGSEFNSQYVDDMTLAYSETPIRNASRIAKPTKENLMDYIVGENSSMLGVLQSCPSTNIQKFNLTEQKVMNTRLEDIVNTIKSDCSELDGFDEVKDNITPEAISSFIKEQMLDDNNGFTLEILTFQEPNNISSPLEKQIFGDLIVRDGTVSTTLESGGQVPPSAITEEMMNKYLSREEKVVYASAVRSGNRTQLKILNTLVSQRVKRELSDPSSRQSPPMDSSPAPPDMKKETSSKRGSRRKPGGSTPQAAEPGAGTET